MSQSCPAETTLLERTSSTGLQGNAIHKALTHILMPKNRCFQLAVYMPVILTLGSPSRKSTI